MATLVLRMKCAKSVFKSGGNRMPDILPWVWLAIGLTFFYFAIVFYQYSQKKLRSFSIRERQQKVLDDEPVPEEMNIFHELLHDFEQYLESINKLINRTLPDPESPQLASSWLVSPLLSLHILRSTTFEKPEAVYFRCKIKEA
jgi:hypothetical protein